MCMFLKKKNGSVNINGRSFSGNNVSINNGKVVVDGVLMDKYEEGTVVNVTIIGDVESLSNEVGSIKATTVGSISTMSGDVYCGDVGGSVKTMSGDVECKSVLGNISTMSGDVSKSLK